MTDPTFHRTKQDVRKPESRLSLNHRGRVPATSDVSAMKSIIDTNVDKWKEINERKANLPLPEDPPTASDWESADIKIGDGSGRLEGPVSGENNSSLRWPDTASSSARISGREYKTNTEPGPDVGRQGKDGLSDLPWDARAH